jgi:hypothetical protein
MSKRLGSHYYFVSSDSHRGFLGLNGRGYLYLTSDTRAAVKLDLYSKGDHQWYVVKGTNYDGFYIGLENNQSNAVCAVRDWNYARYIKFEGPKIFLTNNISKDQYEWRVDAQNEVTVHKDAEPASFEDKQDVTITKKYGWRFVKKYAAGTEVKEAFAKTIKLSNTVKDQVGFEIGVEAKIDPRVTLNSKLTASHEVTNSNETSTENTFSVTVSVTKVSILWFAVTQYSAGGSVALETYDNNTILEEDTNPGVGNDTVIFLGDKVLAWDSFRALSK